MGYRSLVCVALTKEAQMKALILGHSLPDLLSEADEVTERDEVKYWQFYNIKWYESYPEVAAVDAFLDKLDEKDYGFIRIGEDYTDIDNRGSSYDLGMDVERTISFDI